MRGEGSDLAETQAMKKVKRRCSRPRKLRQQRFSSNTPKKVDGMNWLLFAYRASPIEARQGSRLGKLLALGRATGWALGDWAGLPYVPKLRWPRSWHCSRQDCDLPPTGPRLLRMASQLACSVIACPTRPLLRNLGVRDQGETLALF